jgi:hypothetical protein
MACRSFHATAAGSDSMLDIASGPGGLSSTSLAAAAIVPVVSSLQLFHWWRVRDWPVPAQASPSEVPAAPTGWTRWWRKDRRGS